MTRTTHRIAGETACATTSTAVFPKVGQAVSPADFLAGRTCEVAG
jgi:hypothetical protein